MKFTSTQENLNRGLALVSHVASKNISLPILNNVHIKALPSSIELMATNLEIGITISVRGKVDTEGSYTASARILSDYVGLLAAENISIELGEHGLLVTSQQAKTLVKGAPAEDFPLIPEIDEKGKITCASSDLHRSLGQVVFAAATDEMRPEISGVLFVITNNALTLAATDSYRLAEKKLTCKTSGQEDASVIVPLSTLHELMRIISEDEGEVAIYLGENQILFKYHDVKLISRLIEGAYPDYQQIIPKTNDVTAKVATSDLTKAIKAASLFCKPGINDVTLSLDGKKKNVQASASNSQSGESTSTLQAHIEGKGGSIVFNYRYFLDGLAALDSDTASFMMTTGTNPGVLRSASDKDYTYIIMPIRQ